MKRRRSIAFASIASAACSHADAIVTRWLSDGRREGREWVAKNPKRADGRSGSFKVNLNTGRWGDFATGDKGGDLISLAAFLFDMKQDEAALQVADMLGLDAYE
ncbi:hypothetical protein [Methylobacterium gnaphalii]|uniref:Zinc finger CHC2-type domain-containing protein n=1 Tax=Methylobacterium gnaphalii TaxID=1010610 RepID=A0A512JRD6_9HYPH|nr:hypothetical protein [Methylobacterium gnaphalii]GEP12526.1 hypothetical protein MGN01_43710 [Methylobacterium gnaphalii]GJD70201.1 hypothetical protein MMMDOFMJ_3143 [Methylobacterium gnaphalii]GLS51512.1 hypothetical protein GCM10007885_43700 [Methylobacterium gnaphalii]